MTTTKLGPANREKDKNCPPHKDSGWRCSVAHYGPDGQPTPQCNQCSKCGRWVKHDEMDKPVEVRFCDKCGIKEWTSADHTGAYCSECYKSQEGKQHS